MAANWTSEQILKLAPDAASAAAGRGLANAAKWQNCGFDREILWGECQGSGKNPYQTVVELSEPAFKCSCPSRKFPCKHGLALFLLFAAGEIKESSPLAFAVEWLAKRLQTRERKTDKVAAEESPEIVAKRENLRAKRAGERETKVAAGLRELELWLKDLTRGGLAAAQTRPADYWEQCAKRLVDAQSPNAAALVREMSSAVHAGENWTEKLLTQTANLFLLCESYKNIENLPAPVQADVRAAIGWTIKESELEPAETVRDEWLVTGRHVYEEGGLRVQRSWLYGEKSGRDALVLDFAFKNQPHDVSLIANSRFAAALKFYPSNFPLRAVVGERFAAANEIAKFAGHCNFDAFADFAAHGLARNVWLKIFPARLEKVILINRAGQWLARDGEQKILPLSAHFGDEKAWQILAASGGAAVDLFGEWNGETLLPLGVWHENEFLSW